MTQAQTVPLRSVSKEEWDLRVELAACYRLFVRYGWTDGIFTHLSARAPGVENQYLMNPFGLMFSEITASNLIKVDFDGNVIAGDYPYNDAGHAIHTSVLKARPDVNVVLHSHTRAGMAVSCMKEGLLPLSQQAGEIVHLVSYHKYGIADESNPEECEALARDMDDKWLMVMHNHGLLSAGRNVAEAFYLLLTLENACKVQVDVMASRAEMIFPDPEIVKQLGSWYEPNKSGIPDSVLRSWEANVRMLDAQDQSYKQ
ncbi:MAG: class II aldolase/adducin family protein [Pseudomonadota bacterium]